jgi:formate hydrogenlyase subunit 3/multisubunit Na+/H+ antiporter MnhD subunit
MTPQFIVILIGWLIALAIFFGFIVLLRYLHHKERMALITSGINPADLAQKRRRSRGLLRAGLITGMVGLALTIGLYPLGFLLPFAFTNAPFHLGPWLLPGLIPLGVGAALIVSYYLEQNNPNPPEEGKESDEERVIPIQDHRNKERQERS